MSYGIERGGGEERETRSRRKVIVQRRERESSYLLCGCPNMVSKHVSRSHRLTLAQPLKKKKLFKFKD